MIRNNDIRGGPAWSVTIGPQDGLKDEWVREVLIEKNTVDDNKYLASAAFYINSSNTTLRNNQFVGGAGAIWDYSCIMVTRRGVEPIPSGVEIYNNTRYTKNGGHQENYMVSAQQHQGAIIIKNNLIY